MGADTLKEKVHRQRHDVAALAVQNGAFTELVDILGHPCVNAGAGNGQGDTVIDLDGIYGKLRPVPQILRVPELLHITAEILEEVVAGADGDDAHSGVIVANDAVGHLVYGAIAAAGIKAQLLAGLTEFFGQLCCVALALGEDALHIQIMPGAQGISHVVNTLAAVGLAGRGIDDKNMFHKPLRLWKRILRTHSAIIAGVKQNLCTN